MNLQELTKQYDFTGKTVAITGGAGILGGEMACALVGCNANVAMLDRNLDPAQGLLDLMGPGAARAVAVSGDVLDAASLSAGDRFSALHGNLLYQSTMHVPLVMAGGKKLPEGGVQVTGTSDWQMLVAVTLPALVNTPPT